MKSTPEHNADVFRRAVAFAKRLRPKRTQRKVLPRKLEPSSIERDFFKRILPLLQMARDEVMHELDSIMPQLAAEAAANRRGDGVRLDASRVNTLIDKLSKEFFEKLRPAEIEVLALEIARRTSSFEKEQAMKQIRAAFGVDVLAREPALASQTDGFVAESVALIKSIPNKFFDDVEATVTRAVNAGTRPEELREEIQKKYGVSERRAALIARDQVGKFFGKVAEERQRQMGVTHYIWRTANDERVREEHAAREGQVFAWDEPPEGGNPGEDFQCRCSAEPVLDPLLDGDEPIAQAGQGDDQIAERTRSRDRDVDIEEMRPEPRTPEDKIAARAQATGRKAERDLDRMVERGEISKADVRRAEERLARPLTINFPADEMLGDQLIIERMLEDGRLKTIHETKRSGFVTQPERVERHLRERREWEEKSFGPSVKKLPDSERPISAAVNVADAPEGAASFYGGSYFVLKEHVKERAVLGKIDEGQPGVPATDPRGLIASRPDLGAKELPESVTVGKYVEAGIVGGVDLTKDIAEIRIEEPAWENNPRLQAAAKELARKSGAKLKVWSRDKGTIVDVEVDE